MSEILILYVPCPDNSTANELLGRLIKEKLVACGNVSAVQSSFFWEGNFCTEDEAILLMKTLPRLAEEVLSRINLLHPYDTPCIASWHARVNEAYFEWVSKEVEV